MTTWTDNLEVPHLDQNVAEPEIPENVAKDIFDAIFSGMYTTDFPSDADYIYAYTADPKLAQPWHNFVQEFTDIGFPLLATRTVTFPKNNRPYLLINNTDQTLNFKVVDQTGSIALANGGTNMYCYSDGTDLIKLEFASDTTTLLALTDTPSVYDNTKILRSTAAGTEWYDIVTDLALKVTASAGTLTGGTLAGTTTNSGTISGGTMSGATISGTTTNSGTIDGGILLDSELKDFSITEQTVTSGATPDFDLSNGNIINYTHTEIVTSSTFTTTQTSTSFKLLITNGSAFTFAWPTMEWDGGNPPSLQASGKDLLEITKIGSGWIGYPLALNIG